MPKGWKRTTLGEVADYQNGYPFKPEDLGANGLPVVRIKQLLDPSEEPDRSPVSVDRRHHIDDGDLIFSWSGTLAVRFWDRGPALLNQHLFRVTEREGVYRGWLRLALDHAIDGLSDMTHGTTMRHITKSDLLPYPIALPDMSEQRRIVDLMDAVDRSSDAVGELASSTSALLETLREDLIGRSESMLRPLAELLVGVDGGSSPLTEGRPPEPGEPAVLKLSAVQRGWFNPAEAKALPPHVEIPELARVHEGDVLITRSNTAERVGMACYVDIEPESPLYLSDLTLRLQPDLALLDSEYLGQALQLDALRRQILDSSRGTSGSMKKISRATIRDYLAPVPGRDDQRRIVETLRSVRGQVDASHRYFHAVSALRDGLLAELLSGDHRIPDAYEALLVAL
jgi:type I restriction enzyme S subunit